MSHEAGITDYRTNEEFFRDFKGFEPYLNHYEDVKDA